MNANELAEKLLENNAVSWGSCTYEQHDNDKYFKNEAATMLRQQQAEIEALKERCAFLEDQAIMIEPEEMQQSYVYKHLFGEDMLEANRKINNMLRQMVDELPLKDKP